MATVETERLRRAVVYVVMEVDLAIPGSSAPLLSDYAKLLAQDVSEAEILTILLELPPLIAEASALQTLSDSVLAAMMRPR